MAGPSTKQTSSSQKAGKNTSKAQAGKNSKGQTHPTKQTTEDQHQQNRWRRHRYHLVASQSKISLDDEESYLFHILTARPPSSRSVLNEGDALRAVRKCKIDLLHELATTHGDVTTPNFKAALAHLTELHTPAECGWDARDDPRLQLGGMSTDRPKLEGMWLTLSRPNFAGCLGLNQHGEFQYSLGRMAFDMFRPTDLVCSIQGTFNPVDLVCNDQSDSEALEAGGVEAVPKSLKKELVRGDTVLRTYNIVTAFTIEAHNPEFGPSCPNHSVSMPIKGIMTTRGYVLPDPSRQNRLSVWFTGGSIEVNDEFDLNQWKELFDDQHLTKRQMSGRARIFAARMLMGAAPPEETGGMEEDGTISYSLRRPIGGHGKGYVDVLYMDGNLRVVKATSGAIYVFARVPQ